MSASLVRATVRAVSKRKLQPTRAALTLVSHLGVRGEAAARGAERVRPADYGSRRAVRGARSSGQAEGAATGRPGAEVTAFWDKGHGGNAPRLGGAILGAFRTVISVTREASLGSVQRKTGKIIV